MPSDKKIFLITFIGLDETEESTLRRIFDVTTSLKRPRAYEIISLDDNRSPDIAIVNSAHPQAMQQVDLMNTRVKNGIRAPIVYADPTPSERQKYYLRRPWFAGRVLKVVDEVTIREMDFIPEVKICDHSSATLSPDLAKARKERVFEDAKNQSLIALVVDDSLPVRKQVDMELSHHGVRADLVDSGEEALVAVSKKKYDAIFLDVVMPGMNGYDVCKAIRRNADNRKTPVIMLTSKSSSFDKVKGKFAGCSSYITKPVARDEFQKVLKQYLSLTEAC